MCPGLRQALFKDNRPGYVDLAVDKSAIKTTIYGHPEFTAFINGMNGLFAKWRKKAAATLKALKAGCHPKQVIVELSEDLLAHYTGKLLIDKYDVYQHLMDYWAETMQDDLYLIAADGWRAETVMGKDKKGKDKGWACDLVPKPLIVARYFAAEQELISNLESDLASVTVRVAEMEEEHGGEEGAFSELDKVSKVTVTARLKEIKGDSAMSEEADVLNAWLKLSNEEADLKRTLRDAESDLDGKAYAKYPPLSDAEVQALVVDDKWLAALGAAIHGEMDRISQGLTQRVKELGERYEIALPQLASKVADLEQDREPPSRANGILLELTPGYKQTELGVIPDDWEVKQIGQFDPYITSGSRGWAAFYSEHGALFIRITNLSRRSIYLDSQIFVS